MLGKAFGGLGMQKACSYVFASHAEGARLLPGSGFLVEAILRDEACDLEGRRVDVYRVAITEGEWAG